MDPENTIIVSRTWYNDIVRNVTICTNCPFCGSTNLIVHPGDETFMPRRGCLNCNEWFTKPELKRK